MDKNDFGAWLKERRVGLGLSQAEVATRLDVSQATISAWEKGYKNPLDSTRARVINTMSDGDFLTAQKLNPNGVSIDLSVYLLKRISQALDRVGVRNLGYEKLLSIYRHVADVEDKLGYELDEEQMSRFVVRT